MKRQYDFIDLPRCLMQIRLLLVETIAGQDGFGGLGRRGMFGVGGDLGGPASADQMVGFDDPSAGLCALPSTPTIYLAQAP